MKSHLLFICCSLIFCCALGQSKSTNGHSFDMVYEIQVFQGLTKQGTQNITINNFGLTARRLNENLDIETFSLNFRTLDNKELVQFQSAIDRLHSYLDTFNFENNQPQLDNVETLISENDTLISESIRNPHDLGTRILIIDNDFKSYFKRYFFCDNELDEFVEIVNSFLPSEKRENFEIKSRCK